MLNDCNGVSSLNFRPKLVILYEGSISCIVIVPAKMDVAIHSRSEKNL